jgi:hypothetical protein
MARDSGVDSKTVKEYYQILCDTLLGRFVLLFMELCARASYLVCNEAVARKVGRIQVVPWRSFFDALWACPSPPHPVASPAERRARAKPGAAARAGPCGGSVPRARSPQARRTALRAPLRALTRPANGRHRQ